MTSSVESRSSADAGLRALVTRGFQFMQSHDDSGEIAALIGVRGHDNVIDVLRLEGEDSAAAMRMPADEENVLAPASTTWRYTGNAHEAIEELLDLPDDRTPGSLLVAAKY